MKRTLLSLAVVLGLGMSAQAQTPKEVAEPYKAYRTALKADNPKAAADFAYEAWQQAEGLMGDTRTTGDLAANFAELRPKYIDEKQAWKHVMKAYKRSIDLSSFHKNDAAEFEIDRRAKYLSWLIPNIGRNVSGARDGDYSPKRLKARIEELGMTGTTFDAESMAFSAQTAMLDKRWSIAERDSIAAIDLFDKRTDGLASIYEFAVPIFLARAYAEQDAPIDAALTYQSLMTKMEVRGGHDNPISSDAYGEWIRLRDEIAANKRDDPRADQVMNFVVPDGRAKELTPLLRKPPVFPPKFTRGNKSGFVKVRFNVDINGHVVDPIIISSTKKTLHSATLESLKSWRYTPNLPEAKSQDIDVTIRFDLATSSGRRLPYGEEKIRP